MEMSYIAFSCSGGGSANSAGHILIKCCPNGERMGDSSVVGRMESEASRRMQALVGHWHTTAPTLAESCLLCSRHGGSKILI
jgi:hypothetical protein